VQKYSFCEELKELLKNSNIKDLKAKEGCKLSG
jgi:hypothetical protein